MNEEELNNVTNQNVNNVPVNEATPQQNSSMNSNVNGMPGNVAPQQNSSINSNVNGMPGNIAPQQNLNMNTNGNNVQQNTTNTQQNQNTNYSNMDTNDKNTVFGTTQDGKTIDSARKIKGELIGGYILFGIPVEIILYIINRVLINTNIATNVSFDSLVALAHKAFVISIPLAILSIVFNLLIVFLSSKTTFSKRKIRRIDIENVMKTVTIVFVICGCISIFGNVKNYNNISKAVDTLNNYFKIMDSYGSSLSTELSSSNEYQNGAVKLKKIKSDFGIRTGILVVSNLAVIGLSIVLQKRLLEQNAEE